MAEEHDTRIEAGDELLASGDASGAFELFDALVAEDPEDVAALVRAGAALLGLGELPAAWRYLEQALARDPEDGGLLWLLGTVALAGGQGELAYDAFRRAAGLGVHGPELSLDLAVAAYYALDRPAALGHVAEAAEAEPENPEVAAWRAKLVALDDEHVFLTDVARAHCREGRFGRGIELFMAALEYGDSFEARYYLGLALLEAGETESARAALTAALEADPDSGDAAAALAEATSRAEAASGHWPRFCTACGAPFSADDRFCTRCGTPRGGGA
ncbi:MAG: tetratricopeptide repeat protein [Anaerosomatales bacterium]|nr:tetratricopeptide repeat protein [Anaerosomatales bacterium]